MSANYPSLDLTKRDYELIADAIDWELDFLTEAGWRDCPRFRTLYTLQQRIYLHLKRHDRNHPQRSNGSAT